jgi:F-type H+-transporting ATPase subunit gamma
MAGSLKDLKTRIKTAKNITQIAKAMEMISASKIRRAKQSVENNRPYTEKLIDILGKTLQGVDMVFAESPYIKHKSTGKKLIIAVSPDKGLCGSLVENIVRHLSKFDKKEYVLITVGKKIERYAARHGYDVKAAFSMGSRLPKFEVIYPILDIVDKLYLSGEISEVHMLYSEFKNMMSNTPITKKLLPVSLDIEIKDMPAPGYKYEPVAAELLNELIPYYTEVRLYNCLINAFTTEQAARMLAMQNAKNNALEITDFFTLSYNKLRQEKITNDILDITNAMIA